MPTSHNKARVHYYESNNEAVETLLGWDYNNESLTADKLRHTLRHPLKKFVAAHHRRNISKLPRIVSSLWKFFQSWTGFLS